MNKAIITDVRYRMSLSIIRSLGRKGINITTVESDTTPKKAALGFYSRYTSEKVLLPGAGQDQTGFIEGITRLAQNTKDSDRPVLIPVGLDSLMAVSRYRSRLEPFLLFSVPPIESIEIANDTNTLLEKAIKLGIPCPSTTTLSQNETIEELSLRLEYPVVIKYRKGELLKLKPEKRYKIIKNSIDFIPAFSEMHNNQPHPLVQKYISGAGYGVSAVFDHKGEPLEIFCHKRIREYPVTGGPSCFCESVWNDRLVEYAIKLLKSLNWCGVAMVEFKGDPDGDICLMEINPRFWGSMALSVASKSNIPYAQYKSSLGETLNTPDYSWNPNRYKLGKRMRFVFQDLLSLPGYLRLRKDKIRFLLGFFIDLINPKNVDGVLEFRDWRPSLAYILQVFKKAGRGN